jgi:hypothetical protein
LITNAYHHSNFVCWIQAKPADNSIAEKVDQIVQIQEKQGEQIDKLSDTLSKEKPEKLEWFTVNLFGRPL